MTRDAGSTCQCNENADDKLRIGIYREAWKDAEEACRLAKKLADGKTQDNDRLRVENEKLWAINTEKNNLIAELQQRVLTLEGHKARYQQEILQLEQECETYRLALHSIAKTAESVGLE